MSSSISILKVFFFVAIWATAGIQARKLSDYGDEIKILNGKTWPSIAGFVHRCYNYLRSTHVSRPPVPSPPPPRVPPGPRPIAYIEMPISRPPPTKMNTTFSC